MLMIIIIEGPEGGGKLWLCFQLHATKQTRFESLQSNNNNNNNNLTKTNTTSSVEGTNRCSGSLMSTDMSEVSG
jgi:hypothetical protein